MNEDLGFLLADASRLLRRAFDERARTKQVTRPQWRVLALLRRFDGSTQISLAEMLDVEPITMGRMIDRLQEAELVERRADPTDRRAWRLHLTPLGKHKVQEIKPLAIELFDEALDGLTTDQQQELQAMLNVIRANLTRYPKAVANG